MKKAKEKHKTNKNQKGITLIALVVTIVILLILAGITITTLFGENGLITTAKLTDKKTQEGAQNDIDSIGILEEQVDSLVNGEYTDIYVTLYTDGTLGFSNNTETIKGKTVQTPYGNIKDKKFFVDPINVKMEIPSWSSEGSIQTVIFSNEIVPKSTCCWFALCQNLKEIQNINNLNTSKVEDMGYMFTFCSGLTGLDLSNFDTSNVTNMSNMFSSCSGLTGLDLSNFNTSKVTDMSSMFRFCESLASLEVSNFDTSSVRSLSCLFTGCYSLDNYSFLNNWNVENVVDFSEMWVGNAGQLYPFTELDISTWNVSLDANVYCMFQNTDQKVTLYVKNVTIKQFIENEKSNGCVCVVR